LSAEGQGEVVEVRCARGGAVTAGQTLMIVRSAA